MKLLKFIPFLILLTFVNSSAYAAQDCDEIKGNIVGKMFCKAKDGVITRSNSSESNSSETTNATEEESAGWKIWKKPKWMKKKN